jgi:hypothetical protein
MSNLNPPGYRPKSTAKLKVNLKLPTTMNDLLFTLVSTQRGWLLRQALKLATTGGTAFTTWLIAHGVPVDGAVLSAGLGTLAIGVLEFALSKVASKIAAK